VRGFSRNIHLPDIEVSSTFSRRVTGRQVVSRLEEETTLAACETRVTTVFEDFMVSAMIGAMYFHKYFTN